MKKIIFKDKCDHCNQMKVCHGYNNIVLCKECLEKEEDKTPKIVGDKNGQKRFAFNFR